MSHIPEIVLTMGAVFVVCVLTIPLAMWLAPKWARGGGGRQRLAEEAGRLEELERRLGEVEARQQRVAELEERLDFAERLLGQQRDALHLGPPKS